MNLEQYIGLEFEDNGRGPKFDCWGLCREFGLNEFGHVLPDFSGDYLSSNDNYNIPDLVKQEKPLWEKVENPSPGNIILFTLGGTPMHVGTVIDSERMLHIAKGINSCIEKFTAIKWKSRIEGFYAYTEH